jgi:hypothetical protein
LIKGDAGLNPFDLFGAAEERGLGFFAGQALLEEG